MKAFAIIILSIVISCVLAQQVNPLDASLEKRAQSLLDNTKKVLEQERAADRGHLLDALEHQVALVEALVVDLKANQGKADHHRHTIEEELLHLENRVAEELAIVQNFANHQPTNQSQAALLAQAATLVEAANEVLRVEPNVREASELKASIAAVEKLVKQIQAKPVPAELVKEEQQLARQEQSLRQLLERIHRRNHGTNPHGISDPWVGK